MQFLPAASAVFPSIHQPSEIFHAQSLEFLPTYLPMLAFTFRNTDGSSDMLCGSPEPSCFIEKIQLFASGQRVEEISYYGRSCFMYSLLKREEGPPVGGPPRGRRRLGPARPARAEAGHAHGATFDRYVRRGQDAPAAAQSGRIVWCYFVPGKKIARHGTRSRHGS